MKDPTLRMTRRLPDGREIETEAEQRGSRVRLRGRLCRDGLVTAAFSVTGLITDLLTKREFLPKEFASDPAITEATFEPIEEIWKHRLRLR